MPLNSCSFSLKHREVSEAANNMKNAGCPPWALIHLAGSDACMCSMHLAQVPFKRHKRHQRNGVVFCLFGSRVFVSCMDAECKQGLDFHAGKYYALSKELEKIHLGTYNAHQLQQMMAIAGNEVMILAARDGSAAPLTADDVQFLKEQARLRHSRLLAGESCKSISRDDLSKARMTLSDCICTSSSNDRTWVEVGKPVVESYMQSLRGGGGGVPEKSERKKHKVCLSGDSLLLHMVSSSSSSSSSVLQKRTSL
jgi:hypothetical protein